MKNNKKNKIAVRVLAIILTALMVVSLAFYTIYMIVDSIRAKKEEENKEQTETAELAPAAEYYFAA